MTRLRPVLLLLLFFGLTSFSFLNWNNDLITKVREQLDKFTRLYPQEKVYLHTDKPHYTSGETIWFKAYLVEGQFNRPEAPSNIVHVDLVDPSDNVIANRNIRIENGSGAGDFVLAEDLPEGEYLLRAYTNYMRNFDDAYFYKRAIDIYYPYQNEAAKADDKSSEEDAIPNNFSAQFFPEGGNLVEGLSSTVAVKTLNSDGIGIDVDGKILDQNDQQVALFKSLKFGMGFFSFTPEPGKKYTAEVTYQGLTRAFPLPEALPQGYVLKIDTRKEGLVKIRTQTNIPGGMDDAFVIGQIRGNIFGVLQGKKGSDAFEGELSTTELPDGVAQFTLFNGQGTPVCERLVFINNPGNEVHCSIRPSKATYENREEVEIELELTDAEGNSVEGDLSMTVTDEASVFLPEYGEDIRTYLLLNSDLRGHIENPGFYFEDHSAGRRLVLDLLMMTQGWRRFNWPEIIEGQFPRINYPLEQGFTLEGKITKLNNNNKSVAADVYISTMGSEFVMDQVKTEEDGEFLFLGLNFPDTTDIIIQANQQQDDDNDKKKKRRADIDQLGPDGKRNVDILLAPWRPHEVSREGIFSYDRPEEATLANLLEDKRRMNVIDSSYAQWSIDLDAVVVKARRKEVSPELKLANATYREPDHRMILDSVSYASTASDIFQLIRGRYPGVRVQGTFPNEIITMRGVSGAGAEALVLLDGIPLDAETVSTINPNDIAIIDILKGASAAIYGMRGINGVVALYSRQGAGLPPASSPSIGIINMKHPGYYKAREFYAPSYDKKREEHVKPDYRTTLFWTPKLETGKNGKAKTSFYTSDQSSTYRIVVEGITSDGRPVKATSRINIK